MTSDSNNTDAQDAFTSTLELLHRYGTDAIIDALTDHARFQAEDDELDLYHRLLAGRRCLELEPLIERMIHFEEVVEHDLAGSGSDR
jgi:hypothetical protein